MRMDKHNKEKYRYAASSLTKGTLAIDEVTLWVIIIILAVVVIGIIIAIKTGNENLITRLFNIKPWIRTP